MTIDSHSPIVDQHVSLIENDLDAGSWGCGQSETEQLFSLTSHLDEMNEHGDAVFDLLKKHGQLPKLANVIEQALELAHPTLIAMVDAWSGKHIAEFSHELARTQPKTVEPGVMASVKQLVLDSESADREVIALSRLVAQRKPMLEREGYIDVLAPDVSAQPKHRVNMFSSTSSTSVVSMAVAHVWASMKGDPETFARVGASINVGTAVEASAHERGHWSFWKKAGPEFNTNALADLLDGAAHVDNQELKRKIHTAASGVVVDIMSSQAANRSTRVDELGRVPPRLNALRQQLTEPGRAAEQPKPVDIEALTIKFERALKNDSATAAHVNGALGSANTHLSSRVMDAVSNVSMGRLAAGLNNRFQSMGRGALDPTGQDTDLVIQRMDGKQLGRLSNFYLNGDFLRSGQRDNSRYSLVNLAVTVSKHTADSGDKVEFMQHLVPYVLRPQMHSNGEHLVVGPPNPESLAVATVLANLSNDPGAFDLALRSIPLGKHLTAVLKAAGNYPGVDLDALKHIVEGAAHTVRSERKLQIIEDTELVLAEVSADLAARAAHPHTNDFAVRMRSSLHHQARELEASLQALRDSPGAAVRNSSAGQMPRK